MYIQILTKGMNESKGKLESNHDVINISIWINFVRRM